MWPFGVPLHFILHKRTCRFYTFFFVSHFFHATEMLKQTEMRCGWVFFNIFLLCNTVTKFAPDSFGFVFNCGQCIWCIVHGKICFRTFYTFRSLFFAATSIACIWFLWCFTKHSFVYSCLFCHFPSLCARVHPLSRIVSPTKCTQIKTHSIVTGYFICNFKQIYCPAQIT